MILWLSLANLANMIIEISLVFSHHGPDLMDHWRQQAVFQDEREAASPDMLLRLQVSSECVKLRRVHCVVSLELFAV